MTPLQSILASYRSISQTEREKGSYFEELIRTYLRNEPKYKDLYSDVWLFSDWAKAHGATAKDTGIDLVAKTHGTDEFHAIQCKCYDEGYRIRKADIDSFFTASGKKPFVRRIIVSTTNDWSENAENSLIDQNPPVSKIDLQELEDSQIDWSKFKPSAAAVLKPKKELRPHQTSARTNVLLGFKSADRGKLIMACGTGKTFTSLKIAEEVAGKGKRVLFLVPSLNLLSQTLTEWTQESAVPLHSFAVCSDEEVGKKRRKTDDDVVETFAHELRYPATTDAKRLAVEMEKRHDKTHMSVVFSTYHSIEVISRAQHLYGLADFDLIICDEAHRTTGATFESEQESNFVKIHDAAFIRSAKRLYMTATPRIYADVAKASAEKDNVALCSMDDEAIYGKQLHVITFSEAVQLKLLTDYKVLVLTIDEAHVSARIQDLLKDDSNQLNVDDAARIIGCWKALSKKGLTEDLSGDSDPMRRAVAFCQVIERSTGRTRKVSSKQIAGMFEKVVSGYQEQEDSDIDLICEAEHVDGSMNAGEKEDKLNWLKAEPPENTCRILSNVRCLSEGVDVPALDAVLFLTPRNSQVDVVQSVGRVMRNAPGKKRGYVILPVVIPVGMEPHEALNDNKVYKVVWQVLQALRSHDDTFDAMINKLDLIGSDPRKMEVIAITDKVQKKSNSSKIDGKESGKNQNTIGTPAPHPTTVQPELQFQVGELERALYAKVVKKCGNPNHWEEWASDIAKIAKTHISRITQIVGDPKNTKEVAAFQAFANELRDDLNDSITDTEVIEMLAQHLITKPVFDALFEDYSFASHNPVSQAMQQVLEILQEHRLEKEADTLEKFYASVKLRAASIDDVSAKQKIVVELYDKFFRNAFPKMTERLGIVYTPVEVVDFIIHSINDLLQSEFGQTLGSKGVHIIDPFTGTGTFITRLLQSGLISKEQLPQKYNHEIHANEIVLLAYYIAAINIEAVYHSVVGGVYQPFEGICLTDTFQMYEKDDLVSDLMEHNSDRRKRQKALDIRVIMGNPPYSAGQKSADDDAANVSYESLDDRIRMTYGARSNATLQRMLFDSYIRALRWATDRLGSDGIVAFVTNAGWIDGKAMGGLRQCLVEEYCDLYVFHLKGNQRTKGEESRREGGKVFGSGSRAPIAISVLVRKGQSANKGTIFFREVDDYLSREEKLKAVREAKSVGAIAEKGGWSVIIPNKENDWVNQRDQSFSSLPALYAKDEGIGAVFSSRSLGVSTNRDAWVFNFSVPALEENVSRMLTFYGDQLVKYKSQSKSVEVGKFGDNDPTKISWSAGLRGRLKSGEKIDFVAGRAITALYRPFTKQNLFFDRRILERPSLVDRIFSTQTNNNLAICTGGNSGSFSALMVNCFTCLDLLPGHLYPLSIRGDSGNVAPDELQLVSDATQEYLGYREGISDAGYARFQEAYAVESNGAALTKEDLFYYVYGLLHSPDYRSRYADNLSKELPRIPAVKAYEDFRAFSQAGRDLAYWHLNYEMVECFPGVAVEEVLSPSAAAVDRRYRVTKMKFGKTKDTSGKSVNDKSTVIYNEYITLKNIPLAAYDYVVNGKPALEWVMERQAVTTDKDSGIVNDANLWAAETMGNAKYPLELFLRVVTVSLQTMKIVSSLPKLEIVATGPTAGTTKGDSLGKV